MAAAAGRPLGSAQDEARERDEVLQRLVAEHSGSVYRVARSVVQDPGLAEDVTQETFTRAWQRLDTYRGDAPVRHWLLRIAHNLAVSTLRTVRDRATDPHQLPGGDAPDPSETVHERMVIEDALAQLDQLSRAIVVLRELEGLTYAEISDLLEVPLPTVKTRLFRARAQLRTNGPKGGRT